MRRYYLYGRPINLNQKAIKLFRSVYGIGQKKSKLYVARFGLTLRSKIHELPNPGRIGNLEATFDKNFILDKDLKQINKREINFALKYRSYKGIRRTQGLPFSGQRTHSNAKTTRKLFRSRALTSSLAKAGAVGTKQGKGKKK